MKTLIIRDWRTGKVVARKKLTKVSGSICWETTDDTLIIRSYHTYDELQRVDLSKYGSITFTIE